jgi:hypothetical protein
MGKEKGKNIERRGTEGGRGREGKEKGRRIARRRNNPLPCLKRKHDIFSPLTNKVK